MGIANRIAHEFEELIILDLSLIGFTITKIISTSNRRNINAIIKNGIENLWSIGDRGSNPHSNLDLFCKFCFLVLILSIIVVIHRATHRKTLRIARDLVFINLILFLFNWKLIVLCILKN